MSWLKELDKSWTIFLDRDGVINKRIFGGYITKVEEFEFLPGVLDAIKFFSTHYGHVFIATNQQGIAKGIMSECNLLEIHTYMCEQVLKAGGNISKCYFAPELKQDELNTRKPKPAMALKAQADFPEIEFSKSIMFGDTDSDIHFGKNLGMKTVRIKTEEPIGVEADLTVDSLFSFLAYV